MPFGSFDAVEKQKATPGNPIAEQSTEIMTVRIQVAARTPGILAEFMGSLYQNMSVALSHHAMAFYAPDRPTIDSIARTKKRYDDYFRIFSQEDWVYRQEGDSEGRQGGEEPGEYHFCLSSSGNQRKAIDLSFRCVTPEEAASLEAVDAVWLMADGVCLSEMAAEDHFTQRLRKAIDLLSAREDGVPVCLILSQIENRCILDTAQSSTRTQNELAAIARSIFGSESTRTSLIPVQIYGGLDCVGMDENHCPILRLGKSLQIYRPAYCQIPALHTLRQVTAERGTDFFADVMQGGLLGGIAACFKDALESSSWEPETLRGNQE